MSNDDFFKRLALALKERENPVDLKPCIIGKVVELSPVTVQTGEENILLVEDEELQLSEWFKFRCNIDSTGALSSSVPSYLESAKSVTEIHSYTGTACTMPEAISYLAQAIQAVTSELLNLKCELTIGDYVIIASLEETDKFILIDKV